MVNITEFLNDESGASAAEYALILALIAAVIIVALNALGTTISNALGNVTNDINGPAS